MVKLQNGRRTQSKRPAQSINNVPVINKQWKKLIGSAVLEVEDVELPWSRRFNSGTKANRHYASRCAIQNGTNTQGKRTSPRGKSTPTRSVKINKPIKNNRQKSAILEVEHIKLPSPHRLTSSTTTGSTIDDYAAQCAVNRKARIAKRRASLVQFKRKPSRRGRKRKYLPESSEDMSHEDLLQWQHHQQQLRNRETATTCYDRKKLYIKELELKILDYKVKYEQLLHQIHILDEQERQTTLFMNATETCTIGQEPERYFATGPSLTGTATMNDSFM